MGYWNRDLTFLPVGHRLAGFQGRNLREHLETAAKRDEPFRCWHDDCFPIHRPLTFEKFGFESREHYAAVTFGGVEHMIELALTDKFYANKIEEFLADETHWTPDGYAWANWLMGAPCESCGAPA